MPVARRGVVRAVFWAIIEHPGEHDVQTLKHYADRSEYLSGEGVLTDTIRTLRNQARWLVRELDRKGYLTRSGRRALAPLMEQHRPASPSGSSTLR
jgi:hypothetical protein